MRQLVLPVLLAVLLPLRAHAQNGDTARSLPVSAVYGVHYGTPLRFSISLGGAMDLDRRQTQGVLALVEQGQHGQELSAGYFRMINNYGSGFSLRGAVIRTDGEPWHANPHTTYLGGEAHWMLVLGVGGRAGIFRRVSGQTPGEHDVLGTIGVSIGY